MLLTLTRYSLYSLLIFTPLAIGSVQGWAISIIHMVTLLALTAFLLEKSIDWSWEWIKTPLDIPILCLLVLCILSSVFSVNKYTSIWSSILLLNYILIFYLTIHTFGNQDHLKHLICLIIYIAACLSIFGLVKKFNSNAFPWLNYFYVKPNPNIVSSTYVNPNHFAGYLTMSILLAIGFLLTGAKKVKIVLLIFFILILLIALILSLSRGGWLSLFFGSVFMLLVLFKDQYVNRKTIVFIALTGFILLAFIILTNRPVVKEILSIKNTAENINFDERVHVWQKILDMIYDHPALGTGPGTFALIFTHYQPPGIAARYFMAHNDYLHFISEVGVPLIIVMIWMIIALFVKGFKKLNNAGRMVRGVTIGAMSGIISLLFFSIFDFNLHIPANAILFTVLVAIVISPLPEGRRQRSDDRRQTSEVRSQKSDDPGEIRFAPH